MEIVEKLVSLVDKETYGEFSISSAPGRVNLIGEHTDYNEGFVLPCAINLRTFAVARKRKDKKVKVISLNLSEEYDTSVEDIKPSYKWWGYILGCAYILGIKQGFTIAVFGEVPLGGGLSSSASLEVASMYALAQLFSIKIDRKEIAFLSRKVENEFVGVPCGIMDQLCSAMGKSNHALLIDCRTYDIKFIKFPEKWSIVVCDSGVKHELGTSEYRKRQEECKKIVEIAKREIDPKINSLRDLNKDVVEKLKEKLGEKLYKRAKFVVEENERVIECSRAISEGQKEKVKELFKKSHIGLSEEYEVSCKELDTLFEIAYSFPKIIGARMTGGGFGGNTINIIEKGTETEFINYISENYKKKTGRETKVRIVEISDGVSGYIRGSIE